MTKITLVLAIFFTLSTASAANYLGGSVTIHNAIGGLNLHYQTDSSSSKMRYSLDIDAFRFGIFGPTFGGTAAYLADFAIPAGNINTFHPYYGAGLSAVLLGDAVGVMLHPHGLLGGRFDIAPALSLFGEANVGPTVTFGGRSSASANFGFGWNARIGLNYRLK